MKRLIALFTAAAILLCSAGCADFKTGKNEVFTISMVTDAGGVDDQSFNQSAWEGLQEFSKQTGANVSYIESTQTSDFVTNMDKLADRNCDLIWGIGFAMADALERAAKMNVDINYAIADNSYGDETLPNVTGVVFRSQEAAFLVGYIAGKTTKTNNVAFIGGIRGDIISQFEYGYTAGVKYAAKELNKDIKINSQYVESFSDEAKGKATASKMYLNGCDIIFSAAGGCGNGVIEAAKEADKFAIGVDRDQSYLAPKNVLTSALKKVGKACAIVSNEKMNGNDIGGRTEVFGLKEGCVGLPEENPNVDPKVLEDTKVIEAKIAADEIVPPGNKEAYEAFIGNLG